MLDPPEKTTRLLAALKAGRTSRHNQRPDCFRGDVLRLDQLRHDIWLAPH